MDVDGDTVPAVRFVVVPPSRVFLVGLTIVGVLFLGLAVTAAVLSAWDGEFQGLVGFVVLGTFGAVYTAGGIAGMRTSWQGAGVDLAAEHVVVALAGNRTTVRWDDIAEIRATSLRLGFGTGPKPVQNWIVVTVDDPARLPALADRAKSRLGRVVNRLAPNVVASIPAVRVASPVLLYHGLRHYLAHPGARHELADGSAVDRLRGGIL